MAQDFDWLGKQPERQPPRSEHIATFWMMRGPSNHVLTCAAYSTDTGIELRTFYNADNIVATQLFRGPNTDEQVAEHADSWRLNLMLKGFCEWTSRGTKARMKSKDR